MALTGSSRVAATTQNDLVFLWSATQSVTQNQSTVSWSLQLTAGSYGRISATPGSGWAVSVDGQSFSGTTSIAIGNNETKVLASGSVVLQHGEAGERAFDYSFRQDFHITFGSSYIGTVSGSGSAVLDAIARASQPTASAETVTLGSSVEIFTNPQGDFTHALEYSFGNASGVIARGVGGSALWTPDMELARQIPDAVTGVATVRCKTYRGDTLLGTRELALSLAVPEGVIPTVEAVAADASDATLTLGTAVQNVSKFAVAVQSAGAYGSTVVSAQVLLEGKPYTGAVVTAAGDLTLTVTVTDSRGRVGSHSKVLTVAPYTKPRIRLDASRCRDDGTADDTGEFARITLTGAVADVAGRNSGKLTLQWGWETEQIPVEAGEFTLERIVAADSTATMAISATLEDLLLSAGDEMTLSTGYATMDLLYGGRGVAFGTSATREGFDCAMAAFFTGGLNGLGLSALPAAVSGPVLAAVTDGSGWGLYGLTVTAAGVGQVSRVAGSLETEFSLRDGCLAAGYGITGWCLGLAARES